MDTDWWLAESTTLQLAHMASWYVGPALLVAGACGVHSLRLAAAVVCVFGVVETVQRMARRHLGSVGGVLSIVGHLLVWLPFAAQRSAPVQTWLHSSAVLLCVLGVYAALGTWPYTHSPVVAVCFGLVVGLVTTT